MACRERGRTRDAGTHLLREARGDSAADGGSGSLKRAHTDGLAALVVVGRWSGILHLNGAVARKVHAVLATIKPCTIIVIGNKTYLIVFILFVRAEI